MKERKSKPTITDQLIDVHRVASGPLGSIALTLASRRGLNIRTLKYWADELRAAATSLDNLRHNLENNLENSPD